MALRGRLDEARSDFEQLAADGFSAIRRDSNYPMNLALLAEVCVALDDARRAETLLERLLPYRGLYLFIPTLVAVGCGSRYVGLLATGLGRWDLAETAFEEALAVERRMEALPFEALAERDYANMLEMRGDRGDSKQSATRRRRAADIAGAIGLVLD